MKRNIYYIDIGNCSLKEAREKIEEVERKIKIQNIGRVKHETKFEGC